MERESEGAAGYRYLIVSFVKLTIIPTALGPNRQSGCDSQKLCGFELFGRFGHFRHFKSGASVSFVASDWLNAH
jgi:hypothetical protein